MLPPPTPSQQNTFHQCPSKRRKKNPKLSSYEVPHSCFYSEPTPESIFHTSLIFACQKFPVSCCVWPCWFLAQDSHPLISTSAHLPLALPRALELRGPISWSSELSAPFFLRFSISQLTLHVLLFVYCLLSLIKHTFWKSHLSAFNTWTYRTDSLKLGCLILLEKNTIYFFPASE